MCNEPDMEKLRELEDEAMYKEGLGDGTIVGLAFGVGLFLLVDASYLLGRRRGKVRQRKLAK